MTLQELWTRTQLIESMSVDDWFDADFDQEPPSSLDVVREMVEAGESLWSDPRWIRDVLNLLHIEAVVGGNLAEAQRLARCLVPTLPVDPIDDDAAAKILLLATGQFCEVYEGEKSAYPATWERYQDMGLEHMKPFCISAMQEDGVYGVWRQWTDGE